MEVKPGYHLTEVGPIPEDWEVQTGQQITTLIGKGGSPRWQGFDYSNQGMLFVTSENVRDGFLDIRQPKYLPLAFHEKLKRTKLQEHDILINLVGGSIGRSCRLLQDVGEANVNQAVAVFRVSEKLCSEFVACCFQAPATIKRILGMQVDAARPNISLGDLRRFPVPLPPVPEQRAIAGALSDVDALLGALDRVIAKKRDLKQAAMQQLLTGQTRLPGFEGKWQLKQLRDLGKFLKGRGISRDQAQSGSLPCIRYGEIYTVHHNIIRSFSSWISADVAVTATLLRCGDILFAGSGETKEEIGKCVAFIANHAAYAGGDIVIFRPFWGDPIFFGYLLNTAPVVRQKANLGQGDAVVHISATALGSIQVSLPDAAEQKAIATVLSDMDAELQALGQRRTKTAALKQGMMQELLTGRTRLV